MAGYINVHTHLINFDFFPDAYFKIRSPIREWMLRSKLTEWLVRGTTFLLPGKKYNRMHEMQNILKKDIIGVSKHLLDEMDAADILLSTPLMMDLEIASFNEKAETPYPYQVILVSEIAAKYPGKLMPFIMYDPRRPSAFRLTKRALEEMGYLGIKLYPALGYDPDPASNYNDINTNDELAQIYEYCQVNGVPITAHCSPGGSFSGELLHHKELIVYLSQPANWEKVLKKYPRLSLNLAHFGGDILKIDNEGSWSGRIRKMMGEYPNLFADIAYHGEGLEPKTADRYFKLLNSLMDSPISGRIIFGSDWSSTRHTWEEKDYLLPFKEGFGNEHFDRIAFTNPLKFLFPDKTFPVRILNFMRSKKMTENDVPPWLRSQVAC